MFLEALVLLGVFRMLILTMPFKRIAPLLGEDQQETAVSNDGLDLKLVRQISSAVQTMSKYTFWDSKCLVQAYTAQTMLKRRNLPATVYLGVAKDDHNKLKAHAWVRCGTIYVTGGNGHKLFTVTNKFR